MKANKSTVSSEFKHNEEIEDLTMKFLEDTKQLEDKLKEQSNIATLREIKVQRLEE